MRTIPVGMTLAIVCSVATWVTTYSLRAADSALAVGQKAPAFKGTDLEGKEFSFDPTKLDDKSTVLVFLRGFPGYQCPVCSRQVGEIVSKATDIAKANATVVFVYPGAVKDLTVKAKEFLKSSTLPAGMRMLVDNDHKLVEQFKLRWDAPKETAYPSTFVIDPKGIVRYAKISHSHGDRAPIADVLKALEAKSL